MTLSPGTRVGPYEITAPIGAGGMGEVYRARDTKLARDVALKLFPGAFVGDADRLARFQREAQVLASLNHPNIAAIYGLEEGAADAGRPVQALVLELVDGPTLADLLAGPPLGLDEVLRMARQIALALEAAHERGITHRDLKPSNIKLAPDGTVKVLDFGLAKLHGPLEAHSSGPEAPTLTSPAVAVATGAGVILGTAAYMSPEQARGRVVDKRADIWAFGCVLYEMLTMTRAFPGDEVADTIAGVLRGEPDWTRLPDEVPPAVESLLRRCLDKDPRRRMADISTARFVLEEPAIVGAGRAAPQPAGATTGRWLRGAPLAAAGFLAAAATSAAWWIARPRVSPPPEMRLEIATPPTSDLSLAISPDGQKVVFAVAAAGQSRLWLRPLNDVSARPLAGTQGWGARMPFWSPDSRSVGFFADGMLKRVDIDTGSVQTLSSVGGAYGGGTWNAEGVIVFAPTLVGSLFQVPATGGEPREVTRRESSQLGHTFPYFLPDGRRFLYRASGGPDASGIYVGQLDASPPRRLEASSGFGATGAVHAASGRLLFVRQGVLQAQDFDVASLELSGEPVPVIERVAAGAAVSVSQAGAIAYRTGSAAQGLFAARQFVWFDRNGKELGKVGEPAAMGAGLALSRDGRRLVVDVRGADGTTNIWQLELDRGVRSRLTLHVPPVLDISPVWSPDGTSVAFGANIKGVYDLYRKSLTGQAAEELLLATPQLKGPSDWSPDGRFLLYTTLDPRNGSDIFALPLQGGAPLEVVRTSFNEGGAQFSPDGKWVAYRSDKSGRTEVYVQPFPLGEGAERLISTGGGAQPRWGNDGKELFYIAFDEQLMAVPIAPAPDLRSVDSGTPVPLFRTSVGGAVQGAAGQQYVVSRDGRRFLMATVPEEPETPPIIVVLNWKKP